VRRSRTRPPAPTHALDTTDTGRTLLRTLLNLQGAVTGYFTLDDGSHPGVVLATRHHVFSV
jgi:hypothetical protein